ncbi:hypothetical protein D0466_05210 [Peribacillus glennii]|uniref:Uncharacterized protein n=2 Tax=Peribacillus glennii TaxID=2303991 RepID=A0A372LG71_9BACI|nr:hypothetical protein D0466_05210 [Peribacillus glennii]
METMKKHDDYYESLRKMGFKMEREWNRKIKDLLNKRTIIKQASMESQISAKIFKQLQDSMETLSALGNFPTKRDVANVAKMQVQLEEKIDQIEEMLSQLRAGHISQDYSDTNPATIKRDRKAEKRARLHKILNSLRQGMES